MNPNFIHYNRDENSFTARFFERLVLKFEANPAEFSNFLSKIEASVKENLQLKPNASLSAPILSDLEYCTSMPFMENMDMYHYCIENKIELKLDKLDKTEFDFVITARNTQSNRLIFIVFEVKCFSNLQKEEIQRQNHLLEKYKGKLYDEFYHIALISYENFEGGKIPLEPFEEVSNFSIITWEDVKEFISPRIKPEIELSGLFTTIHKTGEGQNRRYLIKK